MRRGLHKVKNRRLFTAGKRLRALRELMGLSRPQFAELVGMTAKRLENIENELQHMHDEDFEKVCGTFPEFSDWIAYEGSIEPQSIAWKVADSAQAAAVYLVERNPVLLERHGIDMQAWRERHREIREALLAAEQAPEAEPAPLEEPPEPRRQRKRKTPASGKGD
ncbi:helix-turn-helix domain-containing protein [Pseudomonas aeruginosa]|uniref:helix-turn-helix domain-containing protein n=6 Tax=Pseudomonas aeruginosa TaxID=287 RepID=UPI0021AE24F3|nr:helix-turn-helix transcriptional regulator [Pseudomonas aeruginosa]